MGTSQSIMRLRRMRHGWIGGALAAALLAGCSALLGPTPLEPQPREGGPVRIDSVTVAADGLSVRVDFTGGAEFSVDDPCTVAYEAEARIDGDTLDLAVFALRHPTALAPGMACDLIGYHRTIDVGLERRFEGQRVDDQAGQILLLGAPDHLAEITGLPAGWLLRREESLPESPNGRWSRTYSPMADPANDDSWVQLIQSFGSPANVSGGDVQPDVMVRGIRATYYLHEPSGEMVLVWSLGDDGVALVGNLRDFTEDEFIQLAESVEPPT